MTNSPPVLQIEDLRVVFSERGIGKRPDVVAVDGVSLCIEAGEIVGLVGESGSGKTTLALATALLGKITEGRISLEGEEIIGVSRSRMRRLRSRIQVVFQDPHGSLDPRQTVRKGLSELRSLHMDRTAWITDAELLAKVGMTEDLLDHLPHELSGGQAQRVSIARALFLRPSLLVADEPTSALDVSVQAQILNLLLQLRESENISVLLISHDLSVVRNLCDRVYVMKDGRVVEEGETEELLGSPNHPYTRQLIAAIPGKDWDRSSLESSNGRREGSDSP
ncbi:MAG: ABC transporter ATP-binding protein [bacterium]|nr:ABC transporter ATP-binding protein [bacterium]MDE0500039.1 ABC transporter ATP-binding protein [bacterium]